MIRAARSIVFSVFVLSCLAAPALGQDIDVSKLPRVSGAKLTYAGPTSTIYVAPGSVEQAVEAVAKALAAAGWQAYSDPFSKSAANAQQRMMTFKKGPQAITAFVTVAPAQGNATSVSYTAVALRNDLPFPKDSTEIGFAPERPHLRALSEEAVAALLDFYRKEMTALGYQAWTGKPEQVSEKGALAFFTRDNQRILVLSLSRNDAGRTRIDISPTTARVLTAESKPAVQTETQEQAQARAAARERHEGAGAAMDAQINALIGQALRDAQPSMRAPQPQATRGGAPVTALRARSDNTTPVPLPETADNVAFDDTKGELEFNSKSDVRSLAAFHNDQMKKAGWSGQRPKIDRDNMVVLDFSRGDKKLSFTIMRFGQGARVRASGSGLVTAAAQAERKAAATPPRSRRGNSAPTI